MTFTFRNDRSVREQRQHAERISHLVDRLPSTVTGVSYTVARDSSTGLIVSRRSAKNGFISKLVNKK